MSQVDEEGEFVTITSAGFYKRVVSAEIEPSQRYRKGVKIVTLGKGDKVVYAGYVKQPFDIAVIDNFGVAFKVNTDELVIDGRTNKGKTLKSEHKKRSPEQAYRIY
jgi:DNA gyrase/topoisomerase IV subunit A